MSRLLHSRRAAWWFGLVCITGVTHLASVIVLLMGFMSFMTAFQHKQRLDLSERQNQLVLALSVLVALAVGVYSYRTMKVDDSGKPPRKHISREWWHIYATGTGAMVAIGTAYTTFLMWMFLLLGLVTATRLIFPFFGLPGHYLL
jgi:hypothetical protein